MLEKLKNKFFDLFFTDGNPDGEVSARRFKYLWSAASFLITFIFILLITNNYLQRQAVINQFKSNFSFLLSSLNEAGWDIAYDKLEYGSFYPSDIVKLKNFKIYKLIDNPYKELSFAEIGISGGFFSPSELSIQLPSSGEINYDGDVHQLTLGKSEVEIHLTGNESFNNLIVVLEDIKINDLADISNINYAARIIAPQQINDASPFFKNYLEINQVKLNGLLDYPLGQNIDRIYIEADVIGQLKPARSLKSSTNEWLARGGKIEIHNLTINWLPLLLVGKGQLSFNDKFRPIIRMNTSSKALINLINQLEEKKWLDSKGVFVARILLTNKAYSADVNDQHLTVTTPISVQEDALLIEKIVVKKWKN